jgi:hypothetical protein
VLYTETDLFGTLTAKDKLNMEMEELAGGAVGASIIEAASLGNLHLPYSTLGSITSAGESSLSSLLKTTLQRLMMKKTRRQVMNEATTRLKVISIEK